MSTNDLRTHLERLSTVQLSQLAQHRKDQTLEACGWHVNLTRQHLDSAADAALQNMARAKGVPSAIEDLFNGAHVNVSEDRPALHWALRTRAEEENDVSAAVRKSLEPVFDFADDVRGAKRLDDVTTVLHLGIGGSDLGPRLLYDAFCHEHKGRIKIRFASNIDPMDLERQMKALKPHSTLVVGVSKSFTSEETMYNLNRAAEWLKKDLGDAWSDHVAIVTANPEKAEAWLGAPSDQIFDMPESVGGRYSLWSAGSLSCIVAFGSDWFQEFLAGARAMDEHFRTAPLEQNIPVRLALADYWNMTIRGIESEMVLAYSNALRLLPSYLQQLLLESNGKRISSDGTPATERTIVAHWGGEGTIGQHSYHQWLHQGTSEFGAEFVIAVTPEADKLGKSSLIAHALAQAEVLANGYHEADIEAAEPGLDPEIVKQKVIPGGHPSVIIAHRDLDPAAVGSLLAMYEHRTFVAGRLWGVNSFDQWGVERGKKQAGKIRQALLEDGDCADPITQALVKYFS